MNEILLGIAVFTGLVMVLSLVVLGARAVLWGSARAQINVNAERVIESALGEKLLGALEHGGVHLPTSCGGVGTCGLCRVRITGTTTGATALPVERAHLSAGEIAEGFRLACQVVVRRDLEITVSPELLVAKSWLCKVKETRMLSPLIKEITLSLPEGESQNFPAGGYVLVKAPAFNLSYSNMIIPPEYEAAWQRMGLRGMNVKSRTIQSRAYSLANHPGDTKKILLNVRLALPPSANPDAMAGVVSSYLFGLKVGDEVHASGPYGNFFIQDTDREIIFIGGGVGMAPFYAHVHDQLERLNTKRTISYWYGARALTDVYYTEDMERLAAKHKNFSWHVALSESKPEDAWTGEVGFIHDVVYREHLSKHPAPETCEYYLCGPPLMIKAVRAMLDKLSVPQDNIFYDDFGD